MLQTISKWLLSGANCIKKQTVNRLLWWCCYYWLYQGRRTFYVIFTQHQDSQYVWLLMKYIISSNVLGEIITSLFLDPPAFYDLLHILLPLNVWKRQKRKKKRKREKITKRPIYDSSRSIYVCIKCRRHSMVNTRVCVPSSLSSHLKSRRVNVCIWHVFTTEESLNQSKLRKYFFFQKKERFFFRKRNVFSMLQTNIDDSKFLK